MPRWAWYAAGGLLLWWLLKRESSASPAARSASASLTDHIQASGGSLELIPFDGGAFSTERSAYLYRSGNCCSVDGGLPAPTEPSAPSGSGSFGMNRSPGYVT